jgi:hypothetical protein
MHPIDSHHNTTFSLKLTWSNIYFHLVSLWCYFWIDLCLKIFKNMLSSGFQHSVRHRALWKTNQCWNDLFQRSQILDELFPSAHTESSVTFSSRSVPARDLVVNLLYHLANHLSRGFLSADDQFQVRRLKWLKIFSLWFPGFKSKKQKWLKFRKCDILRLWFSLILCLPFFLLRQKGGVFFILDRKCISKPVKCFLSQNGQRGVC